MKLTPEEREKAGRKALPKTMRAWLAEVGGVGDFVRKRSTLRDSQGKQWLDSTQAYYRARLVVLGENPPSNLSKKAAGIIVVELLKQLA